MAKKEGLTRNKQPLFLEIQIQTVDACNRRCSFCPRSYIRGTGKRMKINVFKNIIDQLADIGYWGRVTPYLKGEPLLDDRMVDLIRYIRKKLPENFIFLSTNGDLLTKQLSKDLQDAGVNFLKVSAYDWETHHKVLGWPGVRVWPFYDHGTENFNNRGGNIDVGSGPYTGYCARPFQQMYIDYDGKAVICCSDYKREAIMGDVIADGILDVWNNEKYAKYRRSLKRGIRKGLALCEKCNYHGGGVSFNGLTL